MNTVNIDVSTNIETFRGAVDGKSRGTAVPVNKRLRQGEVAGRVTTPAIKALMKRIYRGAGHRLRVRAPSLCALLSGELPLRTIPDLSINRPRTSHAIPNVVYQTWKSPLFGRTHSRLLSEFRALNSDFSFQFFDDQQLAAEYMDAAYAGHPIREIFRNSCFGPMKVDIWRYCILFERGGWYCDINKSALVPLRELVSANTSGIISYERNNFRAGLEEQGSTEIQHAGKVVSNWIFGFERGHPLLAQVIDGIVAKYRSYKGRVVEDPKKEILRFTGPEHLTQCVHEYAMTHGMSGIKQAGIDFDGRSIVEMPGSYVRYIQRPCYELARNTVIVT
ncbi:MAG: glycosyltransferase [Steroidobacteraceae bacterium]